MTNGVMLITIFSHPKKSSFHLNRLNLCCTERYLSIFEPHLVDFKQPLFNVKSSLYVG